MPAENIVSSIMDTIAKNLPNKKSVRFDEGGGSVADQAERLFGGGGRRNLHRVLGGGKPADVLLWRNKKISSSVLAVATAVWVFFEWLDYHFLTIACFVLVLGMAAQFAWSTVRGPSNVPRVELPEEMFANAGAAVGAQVNKALGAVQDVACGRNLKQFLLVRGGDRRVIWGGGHRELVQFPERHLHRVRVRAHSAGAVREVPGPGGRLPQQRPRPAAEPVPEGCAERGRQVQEDRVASVTAQLPFQQSVIARPLPYVYSSAPGRGV